VKNVDFDFVAFFRSSSKLFYKKERRVPQWEGRFGTYKNFLVEFTQVRIKGKMGDGKTSAAGKADEQREPHSTTDFTELDDVNDEASRQRLFYSILSAKPTEEQLQYSGPPSIKAARVLGEAKLATNSAAGLAVFGEDTQNDAEAVRRANLELLREKRKRLELAQSELEASLGGPSKEQLDYPEAAKKRPVSMKALQIFGDQYLETEAKRAIPDADLPGFKAIKVFGSASSLAPPKARKVLGSSSDDVEARVLADKHWMEEMVKRADDFQKSVIAKKPTQELFSIPMDKGPVAEKALAFFGDEGLKRRSLRALKIRAPPKAIRVFGEAGLAGPKAEMLTGSSSSLEELTDVEFGRKPKHSPLVSYRRFFSLAS
jgi:hypothetical protein